MSTDSVILNFQGLTFCPHSPIWPPGDFLFEKAVKIRTSV